jgi:NADH:ubiquinone oxidoreductase subunit 6 (subunit J)
VTVFWASWEASKWLSRKYVPEVVVAVLLVALPMTTYGMFGSWWKKGPEIKRDFSSIDAITDPLARDYYLVVRDLTSQTDHQSK